MFDDKFLRNICVTNSELILGYFILLGANNGTEAGLVAAK